MGGAPKAPKVVYQGPSDADVAASQAALDSFRSQVGSQTAAFQAQIQQQIDAANQQTTDLRSQLAADTASAAAASASQQNSAYAVTASQSAPPAAAETTATVKPKEKPASNLRINLAGTPSTAGAGLNIGV
jgi:hypothetical protein